jgi:hypothetical protein
MHNKYEIPSALLLFGSVVMGAMWANGPVANSSLRLVSANHAGSVDVRTDESGVNRALIPNARGLVFNKLNGTRLHQPAHAFQLSGRTTRSAASKQLS